MRADSSPVTRPPVNGLDLLSNGDTTDSTRPTSATDSHGYRAPSTTQSMVSVSLEERLKRMRAAEELKQQQRYAAFIESQRQADLVRMRAQEERKRKIEEMKQREEARRALVLERRKELELSNKARIEGIRERSRARDGSVQNPRRRVTEPNMAFGRTASASPSLGSARNPNQLMTTSCVVAFGSSAPRSICTQPSPAALRLQQAFEARLASYLTGRHSGCFLTSSALPHYMRLIDHNEHVSQTASAITFLANRQTRAKQNGSIAKLRRAISAHAPLTRPTKASLARSHRATTTQKKSETMGTSTRIDSHDSSTDSGKPVVRGQLGAPNIVEPPRSDEVPGRSNSSQDCHKLGRPPRVPSGSASHSDIKPMRPTSSSSSNSSAIGSVRSISVDTLSRRPESTSGVFDRLARDIKSREKATKPIESTTETKARPTSTQFKAPTAPRSTSNRRPAAAASASKPIPKGMSVSVYTERTDRKRPETKTSTMRKRSASPPCPPTKAVPAKTKPVPPVVEPPKPVEEPTVVDDLSAPEATLDEVPEQKAKTPSPIPPPEPSESKVSPPKPEPVAPIPPVTTAPLAHTGPIKAETQGSGEGAVLNESEAAIYRAKLVEQRRLAKERKEEEQRRLEEENRQRRMQQEAARLAAEQTAREQAEIAAREAEEQQRQREEEERAKLEAAEAERLAKLQRAEEERIMRKKKLDSIMSRVKQTQSVTAASSPALQAQDESCAPPVRSDVSDSKLFEHNPVQIPTDDKEPVNSTDTLAMDSSSVAESITKTTFDGLLEAQHVEEVMVTEVLPERNSTGDKASPTADAPQVSPRGSTSPSHETLNGNQGAPWNASGLSSGPGSPGHNRITSPVNRSPSQGDIHTGLFASEHLTGANTLNGSSTVSAGAPRFKSALLQSMLGGGRLSTRARDAVAGLRRGSANQLNDTQSLHSRDGSGTRSPVYWPQDAGTLDPSGGNDFMASRLQTGSRESLKYGSGFGAASMVRSMFDGSADRYHINGSNVPSGPSGDVLDLNSTESKLLTTDAVKPNGASMFAWQTPSDCDLTAPGSVSPRPGTYLSLSLSRFFLFTNYCGFNSSKFKSRVHTDRKPHEAH
ncbi:unnamed protein product [Echinostoma caproni]|uniref:Ensconsin-like n=1 Tax=Echinostoma caproni TaxID=27848 RepID=A0A183AM31_9TREM|nr:unnamed protein product [Echinostoma caproni]